jgi:asparagine synthase (glutamine-hydrolysing)
MNGSPLSGPRDLPVNSFVAELVRGDGPVRATGIAEPRTAAWVVGHVRLDGREELRDALGAAGVATARDASDSDLILSAWTAWRESATERLRGDFSFALWDPARRVLFCARDALGVRPLYWAEFGDCFVCSNELEAILAHSRATRALHNPAIVSFLANGFNADLTTTSFADVRRLAPAHQLCVSVDGGAGTPRRYWDFPVPPPLRFTRDEEYVERFRAILGDAVRDRLRENSAAILLSGGLDSTSISATARRVAPNVALHAWTHDMTPFAPADEVPLARGVASRLGIALDVVRDELAPLDQLTNTRFHTPEPLDEPEWDAWTQLLHRIGADSAVLIIGDDGDALFRPPGLVTMLRTLPARDVFWPSLAYAITHRRRPHLGVRTRAKITGSAHALRPEAVRLLADPVWQSVLEPAQRAYTGTALDMVWPLLDTRIIEFVFAIPPVPWCQKKELLRRAFKDELTDSIVTRPKSPLRGFFEGQVVAWRASRNIDAIVISDRAREFVDSTCVVDTLRSGSTESVHAMWRVLILDQWLQRI